MKARATSTGASAGDNTQAKPGRGGGRGIARRVAGPSTKALPGTPTAAAQTPAVPLPAAQSLAAQSLAAQSLAAQQPPDGAEAPETREQAVCRLAARGLDEAEIRARLQVPDTLEDPEEVALAAAYQRGRLLGRGQIKEAQFESALLGRVTAQTQVLARLGQNGPGGPDGEPGERGEPTGHGALEAGGEATDADAVAVERRIVGSAGGARKRADTD